MGNAPTNVPDDIRIMIVTEEATEKDLEELTSEANNGNNTEKGVGVGVGVHARNGDTREEDDDEEDEEDNDGTNRNDDGNAGFYL